MNRISEGKKVRVNVNLSEEAIAIGKRLAQSESRSFSNYLETVLRAAGSPSAPNLTQPRSERQRSHKQGAGK